MKETNKDCKKNHKIGIIKKYGIELSNEEKDVKREYGRNWYKNMSEDNKLRLKEYQRNVVIWKNGFNFFL